MMLCELCVLVREVLRAFSKALWVLNVATAGEVSLVAFRTFFFSLALRLREQTEAVSLQISSDLNFAGALPGRFRNIHCLDFFGLAENTRRCARTVRIWFFFFSFLRCFT
jgi:hypothetical protein